MPLYILFALGIAFFAIAFALQNFTPVTINLFIWEFKESLAIVLLVTLAIGVVIGLLVALPSIVKRGWRTSRVRKQAASLEEQLLVKEREIASHSHQAETLRQSYQNLLQSLNLIDPKTGLMTHQVVPRTTSALLDQMKLQPHNERFQSVGVLLLHPHRTAPADDGVTPQPDELLGNAIATVLQHHITVDSWLFSNDQGNYICSLIGLDLKALSRYAETLQTALTHHPLTLQDGSQTSLEVSIGGVLADRDHPTESASLMLEKAQQALEQAQQRGHNRIRIVRVTD
jgi:GGDEF domain-containing protein/uncharacterized integral membrane protein